MTGASSVNPEMSTLEYWDALLSGSAVLPEVDHQIQEVIGWLVGHDDADGPAPEFVARTRIRFAADAPERMSLVEMDEGEIRPAIPKTESEVEGPVWWRRSIWPIAAVLCLALGLAYLFGGGSLTDRLADRWNDDPTAPVVVVPAPTALPSSPVPDSSPTEETEGSPQGASAEMPMYLGNSARTGNSDAVGPASDAEVSWAIETGGATAGSPVIAAGVIFMGGVNGILNSIDAESGLELWSFSGGGPIRTTPVIVDDLVITATGQAFSDGFVYGVDKATGQERWRFAVGNQILSDPLLHDGLFMFGSDDGFVYALNPADGAQVWSYDAGAPVTAAAAAESGTVVFGGTDGVLTALNAADGGVRWQFTPPEELVANPGDPNPGHIWSVPLILGETVFIAYNLSQQIAVTPDLVFALDLETGLLMWGKDDISASLLMPAGSDTVYASGVTDSTTGVRITEFNRSDGVIVREIEDFPGSANASPFSSVIAGNMLYVMNAGTAGEGTAKVMIFDLDDGSLIADVSLPGPGDSGALRKHPPLVIDGAVYAGKSDGTIVAIRSSLANATPAASASASPAASPEAPVAQGAEQAMLLANPARIGDSVALAPAGLPDIAWSFATGSRMRSSPVLSDGVVYIGTTIGQMYAFDASNGDIVWQVDTDGRIQSTALVAGDLVIVAAADTAQPGFVLAYDRATGVEAWRYPVGDQVSSDPLLYEGVVYVGSDDGFVYALNPDDGSEVWKVDTGAPVAWPAAADAGFIVVGNRGGTLFALDATTGAERWRLEPDLVAIGLDPNNIADNAWSMPLIADGRVIVAYRPITMEFSGSIVVAYALNQQNGEIEWLRTDLLGGGPQLLHWHNGVVRAVIQGITLAASLISFDPETGETIGESVDLDSSQGTTLTEGVIAGDRLYMYMGSPTSTSTAPAHLNVYDLPSVNLIGRVDLTGAGPAGEMGDGRPPIVAGGSVYLGTSDGVVFALRMPDDGAGASSRSAAMYLSNPARTGEPDAVGPLVSPEIRWTTDLGGSVEAAPVVVEGLVYAAASDGTIAALDNADGSIVWEFPAEFPIRLSVVVSGEYVYAAGGRPGTGGALYCLDRLSGDLIWESALPDQPTAEFAYSEGLILIGLRNGLVQMFDAQSGVATWEFDTGEYVEGAIAVSNGVVIVTNRARTVQALDLQTGARQWEFRAESGGMPSTVQGAPSQGAPWTPPMVTEEAVNAGHSANGVWTVVSIDLGSGEERWRTDLLVENNFISNNLHFIPIDEGILAWASADSLVLLDGASGAELEATTIDGGILGAQYAIARDAVYWVATGPPRMVASGLETGEQLWAVELPGGANEILYEPLVAGGTVYVGGLSGNLTAIGSESDSAIDREQSTEIAEVLRKDST